MDNAPTERPQPMSSVPDNDLGDVFQRVVHAANVAYYVWVPDTGALQSSSGLQSLFGYDPNNWTPQTFLSAMHPEDVGPYQAALRAHLKSTANQMDLSWRVRARDGSYKWARELAMLERDCNGRVTRVISTVTDVTEAKQREAELHAALEQQTAIAEVLQIITAAPGSLAPVFDTILTKALALSECAYGAVFSYDGEGFNTVATRGLPPELASIISEPYVPVRGSDSAFERVARGERAIHIADITATPVYQSGHPQRRAFADLGGARTALWVALRHEEKVLGLISVFRREVRPFSDRQIALLENFAAQAVIAMGNARLITEQREALEQQTATSEILGVINSSPGDLTPAFDMMLTNAMRLCDATCSGLFTYDGTDFHTAATKGVPAALADHRAHNPPAAHGSRILPMLQTGTPCHVLDIADTDAYRQGVPDELAMVKLGGARTILNVPLLKRGTVVGFISVYRSEVRAFSDKQIALLENFAAQAVIAMENARLITEQREALEHQEASAEILSVIGTSVSDPQPVFDKILESCKLLFGGDELNVLLVDEQGLLQVASYMGKAADVILPTFPAPWESTPVAPAIRDRRVKHYPDVVNNPDTPHVLRRVGRIVGYHSIAFAPMVWENRGIGAVGVARSRGAFSDRELEIMQGFADQAVIAIQNARMFHEIRHARDTAEAALEDLRHAQDRLVQSEKMASLGQLTAGIAHEIKNPLNFINNFSELSADLLDELSEVLVPVEQGIEAALRGEIEELTSTLKGNLQKIAEHGRRADSIVKNMLAHSRTGASERRAADLNATAEEALSLAYHGARAEIPGFNITLEKQFDPSIGMVELYPQEFTRVLVNLINNGFYAARKRGETAPADFEPTLCLHTRNLGELVEITVRDNGTGIPVTIREKIFEPFFTTKPSGEGTGLGLSLCYDIIVKQHGGQLRVESDPGAFTEFTLTLPRRSASAGMAARESR